MKTKLLTFLPAACLLALTAWLVNGQTPGKTDAVPEKYRDTVRKGLEYLVKQQHKDGHWEGDDGKHPVAVTGFVGLALLMHAKTSGVHNLDEMNSTLKYSANIRKAVDWLMDKSKGRDGLIFSGHDSEGARYMQGHGCATLFLAGTLGNAHGETKLQTDEKDDAHRKKVMEVVSRAVKYIVKAQSTDGGWYHTSKAEGHDLADVWASVIQMQALQAAENAGIPVPAEAIELGKGYLKRAIARYDTGPEVALALVCLHNDEGRTLDEFCKRLLQQAKTRIPVGRAMKFGRDELAQYYFAQAEFNAGGEEWSSYRTATFDHLQSHQNKDGSWPASDGISVGPVYATALWCTVLQLDKRNHPSRRRIEELVK